MKKIFALRTVFFVLVLALGLGGCGGGGEQDEQPESSSVTVSGTVQVGELLSVDGDTNEVANTVVSNDGATLDDVQLIASRAVVAGYLGLIGSSMDTDDYYKTDLSGDTQITLILADSDRSDSNLYLYDEQGAEINKSQGTGTYDVVSVSDAGTYIIGVHKASVAGGNYTLVVGDAATATAALQQDDERLSSFDAMVEGEVVYKKPQSTVQQVFLDETLQNSGIEVVSDEVGQGGFGRMKVVDEQQPFVVYSASASPFTHTMSATVKAVRQLRESGQVLFAEPNYLLQVAALTPNDPHYAYQWHYPLINLPDAWEETTGSSDVVVAVIDTGYTKHPDLIDNIILGYDFISSASSARDGDGIDADPTDVGDLTINGSSSFHGTHVSGTVAASSNNGEGVAGVAWNTSIMPVRVMGKDGGTSYDIAQGIYYAAGLTNDSGTFPAQAADIINMSIGGAGKSTIMQNAVTAARNAGVIIVAAAGNENGSCDNYEPAGLTGVIGVSAVGYDTAIAPYSNYGNCIDVAAPGGNMYEDRNNDGYADGVLSTMADDSGNYTYEFSQGTSMASPHVAGVLALMKARDPALAPSDVDQLLSGSHAVTARTITTDLGTNGYDTLYGYGLIDAYAAVLAAADLAGTSSSDVPILSVTPRSVTLSQSIATATLTLNNIGGGELTINTVTSSQDWLSATFQDATHYLLSADTSGLNYGDYEATVSIESNGGRSDVPVTLSLVAPTLNSGNVGRIYLLLIDPDTYVSLAQVTTDKSQEYAYSVTVQSDLDFLLVAGTDINSDGYIDDAGEAFGAYPVLSSPSVLNLGQSVGNLDFDLSVLVYLTSAAEGNTSGSGGAIRRMW